MCGEEVVSVEGIAAWRCYIHSTFRSIGVRPCARRNLLCSKEAGVTEGLLHTFLLEETVCA